MARQNTTRSRRRPERADASPRPIPRAVAPTTALDLTLAGLLAGLPAGSGPLVPATVVAISPSAARPAGVDGAVELGAAV